MIGKDSLEAFQELETPFYHYNLERLDQTLKSALSAAGRRGYHVHYALKANAHARILDQMVKHGIGADCVSGAEVERALEVGFKPAEIAFAGVGKTDAEINLALEANIFSLNVESLEELEVINELALKKNKRAKVALRLNPDVDAQTHRYITTGLEENKFGISDWQLNDVFDFLAEASGVELVGLHFHIGSQIVSLEPFKNLCQKINVIQTVFEDRGFHVRHINAGGGLGIDYNNPDADESSTFEAFFGLFEQHLKLRPGQELHFELGRSLVASCGNLISRVQYIKRGLKTNFMILDAGMTELIRPALYQSVHRIENVSTVADSSLEKYDVVGPVCESSDCFGKAILLPETKRGDLIAIRGAGAYGESMASNYNLRSLNQAYFE